MERKPENTMNKMKARVHCLQMELKALQKEVDKGIQPIKWEPLGGNWLVTRGCEVSTGLSEHDRRMAGMEFTNNSAAAKAACTYKFYHRLYKLAEELNGAVWKPNWLNGANNKFVIRVVNHQFGEQYVYNATTHHLAGGIYFKSEAVVKQAVVILEQELED